MTLAVKHNFVSSKADGTDATLIRPSNWNEDHTITLASKALVGRQTAGSGDAEEIPCSAAAASVLAAADVAAILAVLGVSPPTTGDVRLTLKTTASDGWVLFNDGTIGNATSGASSRANADTEALFLLVFANFTDALAPIFTSAGVSTTRAAQGSGAAAYAASCRVSLTKAAGRAIAIAGSGASLTARTLGQTVGEESHLLTQAQLPNVNFSVSIPAGQGSHGHSYNNPPGFFLTGYQSGAANQWIANGGVSVGTTIASSLPAMSGTAASGGSDSAHNNMQPTTFLNAMVKL